jgi:hypothetical protein
MLALLAWGSFGSASRADAPPALERSGSLPLSGVSGRIDHLAVDPRRGRLFVAALGNDSVEVLDLVRGERLATLAIERPTGIAYLPAQDRLWVASSGDGAIAWFDGTSYELLGMLHGLPDADNLRVDARAERLYVGYGAGGLAIVDLATQKRLGELALPGHPESFQLEARGPRVFVNVPDARAILALDRAAPTRSRTWKLGALAENYPMALDEAGARLFAGFRRPARLVELALPGGARSRALAICADTDDLFYDAARRRVYAICGDGSVDVVDASRPGELRRLARVATRAGARTGLFCQETGELYVAAPRRGADEAAILVLRTRPRAVTAAPRPARAR